MEIENTEHGRPCDGCGKALLYGSKVYTHGKLVFCKECYGKGERKMVKATRCIADMFMYCTGRPESGTKPGILTITGCKHDPAKCGHQVGSAAISPAPPAKEKKKK